MDAAKSRAALFVAEPVAIGLDIALRTYGAIADANLINQVGYMHGTL